MKVWKFLWKIVGLLLVTLGVVGMLAIQDWLSGTSITMPEEALRYIPPLSGDIGCVIVIIAGIIILVFGDRLWNRHPAITILYAFSFLIGAVAIAACYITDSDTAFKVALSILGISIVIITTLIILTKRYSATNTNKPRRIAVIASVMTVYLVLMVGFLFPQWFDTVARSFPDLVLRQAVRNEVGKPFGFITQSDLEQVTHLEIRVKPITRLEGLEKCTGLEELELDLNYYIKDITPLSGLKNLKRLELSSEMAIDNITPLSNLSQLTHLCLSLDGITDIRPLSNLVNLSVLDISTNGIKDVSPLASLTNLTELDIGSNQVSDISALKSLSKLANLWLGDNPISNITVLSQFTEIHNLSLVLCNVSDISPLLDNTGLGAGDSIFLTSYDLANYNHKIQIDNYSRTVVVPELKSRGVSVSQ